MKPDGQTLNTPWQRKWLRLVVTHPELQSLATATERFARAFYKNDPKAKQHFIVSGLTGRGKSHTSSAVYRWAKAIRISAWAAKAWDHPPRVEMVEWGQICGLDRAEFQRWLNGHQNDGVRPGTDILFVEDLGCEIDQFKSGEPVERLRELLNEFSDRWLFITTNFHESEWANRWDKRVADRLHRNSVVFTLQHARSYTEYS